MNLDYDDLGCKWLVEPGHVGPHPPGTYYLVTGVAQQTHVGGLVGRSDLDPAVVLARQRTTWVTDVAVPTSEVVPRGVGVAAVARSWQPYLVQIHGKSLTTCPRAALVLVEPTTRGADVHGGHVEDRKPEHRHLEEDQDKNLPPGSRSWGQLNPGAISQVGDETDAYQRGVYIIVNSSQPLSTIPVVAHQFSMVQTTLTTEEM